MGHNSSEWDTWTLRNNGTVLLVEEETLFLLDMWGNPGHCINDIAFPVFLDSYENSVDIYPIVQPSFFTVLISGEMNIN